MFVEVEGRALKFINLSTGCLENWPLLFDPSALPATLFPRKRDEVRYVDRRIVTNWTHVGSGFRAITFTK